MIGLIGEIKDIYSIIDRIHNTFPKIMIYVFSGESNDNKVKEINLVIETKDYESEDKIPSDQRFEINCAREFFKKLQEDNYNVEYKVQLRTTQMLDIIRNL